MRKFFQREISIKAVWWSFLVCQLFIYSHFIFNFSGSVIDFLFAFVLGISWGSVIVFIETILGKKNNPSIKIGYFIQYSLICIFFIFLFYLYIVFILAISVLVFAFFLIYVWYKLFQKKPNPLP